MSALTALVGAEVYASLVALKDQGRDVFVDIDVSEKDKTQRASMHKLIADALGLHSITAAGTNGRRVIRVSRVLRDSRPRGSQVCILCCNMACWYNCQYMT